MLKYSQIYQRVEAEAKHEKEFDRVSVTETTKLWSTISFDTFMWERAPDRFLSLLDWALHRSGNHPLTMVMAGSLDDPCGEDALELVSQHAPRWWDVFFWSNFELAKPLVAAEGALGQLERLHLEGHWEGPEIFRVAPRLKEITLHADLTRLLELPWVQIQKYRYVGDSHTSVALLGKLSYPATCSFNINFTKMLSSIAWPSLSSQVRSLALHVVVSHTGNITTISDLIRRLIESLMLPRLESFTLGHYSNVATIIFPVDNFLALVQRSSFYTHLQHLDISARLTESDFLRCLSALPILENLSIRDVRQPVLPLVTDSLLQALTRKPDVPPLVPRLFSLHLTSLLRFTDNVFRDFIASCIDSDLGGPFEIVLYTLPTPEGRNELGTDMMGALTKWILQGDVDLALLHNGVLDTSIPLPPVKK
ncbi:hypothetical protein DFH08DRAFT_821739 [Mycena albidolilacea]|uniref:F-box domain-containing protein n=1 Tax=Mycena albidolilacea TaxID=1033008 RepID=A0AAD6Z9D1_9AGAR|nr:hypothetical protein DFH08DRAFT_821739 [Mycena albidolilacea]